MVSSARLAVMFCSSPTPTTARPPVVAVALTGSGEPFVPGSAMAAFTLSSTRARCSSDEGPTWNSTCAALPWSATSSDCSTGGAAWYACSMSRPVGASSVVPGTSISQPTVVARLLAWASSLFCASWLSTRPIWNAPIWSVNAPFSFTVGSLCT